MALREPHATIMRTDIMAINETLHAYGIDAGVPAMTVEDALAHTMIATWSHCAYTLAYAPGTRFVSIERIEREIASAVVRHRLQAGFTGEADGVSLRVVTDPMLAIEIDSPLDVPLRLPELDILALGEFQGLVGESVSMTAGRQQEVLSLDHHYHTLVAAMSGYGKSTIVRNVLLTMLRTTSPAKLRVVLIDLKNKDLVPFKHLPHVDYFASDTPGAAAAIDAVGAFLDERKRAEQQHFDTHLLVVIDELAALNDGISEKQPTSTRYKLAEIMKMGRSLGINVLAATQYPIAQEVGNVVARSFTERMVGHVDGADAARFAAARKDTGAEKLKRPGSFVRVGSGLYRFQSYLTETRSEGGREELERWINAIETRWQGTRYAPFVRVDNVREDVEAVSSAPADTIAYPWKLLDLMYACEGEDGNMQRGFINAAVAVLNGGTLPDGATYQRKRDELDTYLLPFLRRRDAGSTSGAHVHVGG